MGNLKEMNCSPCQGSELRISSEEVKEYQAQIPDWKISMVEGEPRLERVFKFKDFAEALDFSDRVGKIAEQADHHPRIVTEWGKVTVAWWTHKIHGLHQNDFIMAAKTDSLYESK